MKRRGERSVVRFCFIRHAFDPKQRDWPCLCHNVGGPPPGDFHNWTRDDWIAAVDQNMLSAIELIGLTTDGMGERSFGRIVNITSSAVRVPNRRNFRDQSAPFGYARTRAETSCLHSSVLKGFKELHTKAICYLVMQQSHFRVQINARN